MLIGLLAKTGLPVEQDEYTGTDDKYIIFVYEDERPEAHADNRPIADTVYLQVQLITPKKFNYFILKKKIRDLLEGAGFLVTSTRSFIGDVCQGTEKTRQTVFDTAYTAARMED